MKQYEIIAERDDHILVYKDGTVITKINDSYNKLKYSSYNGNRIYYKFDDKNEIHETYDDRIFNCMCNGQRMQIRDADGLCDVIKTEDMVGFVELFKDHYYKEHRDELLRELIEGSFKGRVEMKKHLAHGVKDKGYNPKELMEAGKHNIVVVDGRFMVDEHGTAHTLRTYGGKRDKWDHLCIVVKGHMRQRGIKTEVGVIQLDSQLLQILAKVNFLLNPDIKDKIFMGQLPDWLVKTLIAEGKKTAI